MSRSGQISQLKMFLQKHAYLLSSSVSGFKICHLFHVRQLKMPKIAFQKGDIIFISAFDYCTAKDKDAAFELLRACCLYVGL